jgi:zinc D-Ala-D-Ala carboxypeptidase
MKLSPHFILAEMIKSQTADRLHIDNYPNEEVIVQLKSLCTHILEPIRTHFNKPLVVLSGYRCKALNTAAGGSLTSQHMKGQAADIEVAGISNWDVLEWIKDNLEYDQLIQEYMVVGSPQKGWVHVSYNHGKNRKQFLTVG